MTVGPGIQNKAGSAGRDQVSNVWTKQERGCLPAYIMCVRASNFVDITSIADCTWL